MAVVSTVRIMAVVSTVLLLIVGLMVVAVREIRIEAAQMQCSNNLKSLTLAVASYAGCYSDDLPQATITQRDTTDWRLQRVRSTLPPEKRLSWIVDVAPFMECIGLEFDRMEPWDAPANIEPMLKYHEGPHGPDKFEGALVEKPLGDWKWLQCPENPHAPPVGVACVTCFVGVAGVGGDAISRPEGDPRNGVFGYDRHVTYKDIKDGTSTTLAIIETTDRNGPWIASGLSTARGLDRAAGPYLGVGASFGSNHAHLGFSAVTRGAMLDGSVRKLSPSMSPEVLEALATFGGETLPADW
jgi:Protein of unknown function (DUF1559)